jgi:bacterioferritin-associated ferredoxin
MAAIAAIIVSICQLSRDDTFKDVAAQGVQTASEIAADVGYGALFAVLLCAALNLVQLLLSQISRILSLLLGLSVTVAVIYFGFIDPIKPMAYAIAFTATYFIVDFLVGFLIGYLTSDSDD